MYNQAIADAVIAKYGIEDTQKFCDMNSYVWELIAIDKKDLDEKREALYERDWWEVFGEQLTEKLNKPT